MLNRLSFLSENDDPQKYKGYDGKKIVMSSTVNQVNDMDFQFVHSP